MFCRDCKRDLSGHQGTVCPDCGTGFDPDDPNTFYVSPPTGVDGFGKPITTQPRKRTVLATAAILFYLLIYSTIIPGSIDSVEEDNTHETQKANIRTCFAAWRLQVLGDEGAAEFKKSTVEMNFPPAYSAWGDKTAFHFLSVSQALRPAMTIPLLLYTLLLAILRTKRSRLFFSIATACVLATIAINTFNEQIVENTWPKSYNFVDDYVYVSAPNQNNTTGDLYIVLYERYPSESGGRYVVENNGYIQWVTDRKLANMLDKQGANLQANPS